MKTSKIITTKVKVTESHDRMSLTIKFPDSVELKFNVKRYGKKMSLKQSPDLPTPDKALLQKIFAGFELIGKETYGNLFARYKSLAETSLNLVEFSTKV